MSSVHRACSALQCVCVAVSAVCILTSLPLAKADASEAADESAMESIILFG